MLKKLKIILIILITFFSFGTNFKALTKITINNGTLVPYFSKKILDYNVFVDDKVSEIKIDATKESDDEEITGIGILKLDSGKNKFEIISIIGDIKKVYTLNIYRGTSVFEEIEDVTLEKLSIEGYNIDFKSNVFNYTVSVDENVEDLNIKYKTVSEAVQVNLEGNSNFKAGENIIKITVTSMDGNSKSIYTIKVIKTQTVFKEEKKEEKNIFNRTELNKDEQQVVLIALISIGLVLIISAFYLLFIHNYSKKEKKNKKIKKEKSNKMPTH